MKLISLNTWGGIAGEEKIVNFIKENKVDFFCLQEIWSAPYKKMLMEEMGGKNLNDYNVMFYGVQKITEETPNYIKHFHPHSPEDNYGLLMLVKDNYEVVDSGDHFVYKYKEFIPSGDLGNHARNIQYCVLNINNKKVNIINFHGLWNGMGKTDTEDRLNQSKNMVDFIKNMEGEIVLCGDFNLRPDTESIKIIEDIGLRNLIKENNITDTRTSYYKKPERFADYTFVSSGIKVKDFHIMPDEVSDHAAMFLEFNI